MERDMSQHFHTLNTDLRDSGFLSPNENLQTAEIGPDMQIHHIFKLWTLCTCEKKKWWERKDE